MVAKPRMGVVSYLGHNQYEPRGIRTRAVLGALAEDWELQLIAAPPEDGGRSGSQLYRGARYARYRALRAVALDPTELWARTTLRRWRADVDGALLIGFPFAPVALSARLLSARRIPYVVDASDPWALTASRVMTPQASIDMGLVARRRARREEHRLWAGAVGAILTTTQQERALKELFPHLRALVRPNGCRDDAIDVTSAQNSRSRVLRIGHFGNFYAPRVDTRQFFDTLIRAGLWDSVVLEQFGADRNHTLRRMPAGLEVRAHAQVPWSEVVSLSAELDVAVVVGNIGGFQLPSKVIDYLTLPVPRLAVVDGRDHDSISDYVRDKPGWLIVGKDDPDAAKRLEKHLAKDWSGEALRPPKSESWSAVSREIASFVSARIASSAAAVPSAVVTLAREGETHAA